MSSAGGSSSGCATSSPAGDTVRAMTSARVLALLGTAFVVGCGGVPREKGRWPPEDFRLEIEQSVVRGTDVRVQKHVRITADGLVVVREAAVDLDGPPEAGPLPVFRRVCAYQMAWQSIRYLSRELDQAPVLELRQAPFPAVKDGTEVQRIALDLTYMGNRVDVVMQGAVMGLMNRVLRVVNQYLPAAAAFAASDGLESRRQDVPAFTTEARVALQRHRAWLEDFPEDPSVLRDTFSLACWVHEWSTAEDCARRLAEVDAARGPVYRRILYDLRRRAEGFGG